MNGVRAGRKAAMPDCIGCRAWRRRGTKSGGSGVQKRERDGACRAVRFVVGCAAAGGRRTGDPRGTQVHVPSNWCMVVLERTDSYSYTS